MANIKKNVELGAETIKKLLGWGSQTAPRVIDNITDQSKKIQQALDPDEILEAVPSSSSIKPDIPEATLIPKKVSTLDAVKEFGKNNKGKIATGFTIAELARQMIGQDNEPVMMTPPQAKEKAADKPDAEDKIEQTAIKAQTSSIKDMSNKQDPVAEDVAPTPVKPEGPDFVKMIEDAQALEKQDLFDAKLLRGSENLGAGLARITPDYGSSELARKDAALQLDRAKAKIGGYKDQQGFDKTGQDITDEEALRDPNSKISQETKAQLAKYGINVKTALEAKQLNPQIFNLLMADRAQQNAREVAAMSSSAKKDKQQSSDSLKIQASVDKQTSQLLKSKDYEAYNAAKDAEYNLKQAIESGNKTDAGTAFMTFAKIAQGDNSVVRDGDMAILAGGMNYTSVPEMLSKLAARARGGNFNATELSNMRAVAEKVQQIKGKRVQALVTPIVKRAESAGLDLAQTIDPSVVEEFQSFQGSNKAVAKSMKLQSPKKPGAVITTKSGKTYKVDADGMTATEM